LSSNHRGILFTSESVTEGHPDKIADQISDAVLDATLAVDPTSRVACETLLTTGLVIVAGEITTKANLDYAGIARETIREIGYDRAKYGFDCDTCAVLSAIHAQSPDIAMGVDPGGAGDQGLMFGFACNETPELCLCQFSWRINCRSGFLKSENPASFLTCGLTASHRSPSRIAMVVRSELMPSSYRHSTRRK